MWRMLSGPRPEPRHPPPSHKKALQWLGLVAGLLTFLCLLGGLSGLHIHQNESNNGTTLVRDCAGAYQVFPVGRIPSSAIHWAAFSAIMSVGELVLPLVITGMTPASTMRSACMP